MLIPIHADTPQSKIFEFLNAEFILFVENSIDSVRFSEQLFSDPFGRILYANESTKEKFEKLYEKLHSKLSRDERYELFQIINNGQNIQNYFENETLEPSAIYDSIFKVLGDLTIHLYARSSNLSRVKRHCAETLQEHYQNFMLTNGDICPCCGTEALTQFQANEDGNNKWRGPYDHLLPKSKYPYYAVHPDNLLPTCRTCNSDAKKIKNPVIDCNTLSPCLCCYPYTDSLHSLVSLKFADGEDIEFKAKLCHTNSPEEKTWLRLYGMKDRVENHFKKTVAFIIKDCTPRSCEELKERVTQNAERTYDPVDAEAWDFWRMKLYRWMDTQDEAYFRGIWAAIESKRQNTNLNAIFNYNY